MITRREGREPRSTGICHFSGSLVCLSLSQNLENSNIATVLGFRGSCPSSVNLNVWPNGLAPGLDLRVILPVSRVPSRLPKPQGAGPFRGAACRRWPAAAATRTWGRVRGAGPGHPPPPAGESPGPARGEVPSSGTRTRRAPRRAAWTVAQRSSHVARPPAPAPRLRYGPQPVAPRCLRPGLGGLAYAALSLPLSYSLQPGASDGDAGGDSGLLRDGGPAMHSALGPTALLHGVLGQGKRGRGLSGFLAGQLKQRAKGQGLLGPRVGDSSYSDTPPSPTGLHLHPHLEHKPPHVSSWQITIKGGLA